MLILMMMGLANFTPAAILTLIASTAMWSTTHSNGEAFNSTDMNKVKTHPLCFFLTF